MNRLPISWVPRIFCWAIAFAVLFGISTTAYADVPVLYVQVPQWTDDWAVCAVDIPDAQCHCMCNRQTIRLEKDSTGRMLLGSM